MPPPPPHPAVEDQNNPGYGSPPFRFWPPLTVHVLFRLSFDRLRAYAP